MFRKVTNPWFDHSISSVCINNSQCLHYIYTFFKNYLMLINEYICVDLYGVSFLFKAKGHIYISSPV